MSDCYATVLDCVVKHMPSFPGTKLTFMSPRNLNSEVHLVCEDCMQSSA